MRQSVVIKRYLISWFPIDFLSTVPWEAAFVGSNVAASSSLLRFVKLGKLLRVLRLLRVLKLRGLLSRIEDMFSSYALVFALSILKTLVSFLMVIHWIACGWGYLADGADEIVTQDRSPYDLAQCGGDGPCEDRGIGLTGSPWIKRYGLTSVSAWARYIVAMQYATGMMTGGDVPVSAGTMGERIYTMVVLMLGFLACSMIISQIVVVMDGVSKDNADYLEETRGIRDFMVSRGMPFGLQTKVKRYLDYQFKHRKIIHSNHEVMKRLSPHLRLEIQEHMNRDMLERHPFFAKMEPNLLSEACSLCQSVLYAPGDVVMRKGKLSSSIVFLVRGQLQIEEVRPNFSVQLKPPAWIDDRALFVESIRNYNVYCTTHCELLTIRQDDLVMLTGNFVHAQAYFSDYCQRVMNQEPDVVFCEYCNRYGHALEGCKNLTTLANLQQGNRKSLMPTSVDIGDGGVLGLFKNLLPIAPLAEQEFDSGPAKRLTVAANGGNIKAPGEKPDRRNSSFEYDAWNGEL